MTGLLVSVLTFSLIHTGAWLFRLWREPEHWKGHVEAVGEERKQLYRRFTQFQRIMHLVMLLSFMLLAATGMALKFSWMGWAQAVLAHGRRIRGAWASCTAWEPWR